jgi:hypothetical protein
MTIGRREKLFDCNMKYINETDKAVCCTDDDLRCVWLPKSQIDYVERNDGTIDVTMPEWLAIEKDLV